MYIGGKYCAPDPQLASKDYAIATCIKLLMKLFNVISRGLTAYQVQRWSVAPFFKRVVNAPQHQFVLLDPACCHETQSYE